MDGRAPACEDGYVFDDDGRAIGDVHGDKENQKIEKITENIVHKKVKEERISLLYKKVGEINTKVEIRVFWDMR